MRNDDHEVRTMEGNKKEREAVAADVKAFLKRGGKITKIPALQRTEKLDDDIYNIWPLSRKCRAEVGED